MGLGRTAYLFWSSVLIALLLVVCAGSAPSRAAHADATAALPARPADGEVNASALADVTGDGSAADGSAADGGTEWVLLVWRPWQDWPVQQWSSLPSPIAGYHDAAGDSCHLILLDPQGGEIWAGSALPVPLLGLLVEDVDQDGIAEVVTPEGTYAGGRDGPARHVDVWQWNGFGFTLERRFEAGSWGRACLAAAGRCDMRTAAFGRS